MAPEVEKKLLEYLLQQERADIAGGVRRIFEAFQEHESKDEARHVELRGEVRGISLRVGELERDRDKLERQVEDTGRHEVLDLRDRDKHWQRIIVGGAVSTVLLIVAALVTWVVKGH